MIVTDKKISIDDRLLRKLDMMCDRTKKNFDNVIICDGDEGLGKSNLTAGCAYYCAWKLGRPFTVDNVFFEADTMINFASRTSDQVILWDEAALGGLASEWQNKFQKKLLKMLMIARKKRHIYFINVPKFFKLNEYIVLDRSIALLHVYSPDEIKRGTFVYYRKASKEKLYNEWRKKKRRNYKGTYDFNGRFGIYLPRVIDEDAYEAKKDKAIMGLVGDDEMSKKEIELIKLKYRVSQLPFASKEKLAPYLKVNRATVFNWALYPSKYPHLLGNEEKIDVLGSDHIINSDGNPKKVIEETASPIKIGV